MAIEQQQQQQLFSTLMTVLREKLGDFRSKEKKIFMHSGTYQIILYTHFITRMRGFLLILCDVLTIYCSAADRFQKWQEDGIQQEGLRVSCAFTNKRQQALLAIGRRWIKNQSSKFRRKIARSCRNKSNDTYNSVSSFSLLFLLFLAGDVELNPGPTVTSSNSHSENSVLELPILVAIGNQHQGDACFSEESRGRQCAFMALTSLAYSQHAMSATHWQAETLDEILDMGDSQFLNALQRGFIPDAPTLSVEQLPTTVHFARSNEDNNSDLPFEAQNEISKPIVVLPHVATKANALETPIEAPMIILRNFSTGPNS